MVRASKPIRGSSAKGGTDGLLATAFCPDDGLATPEAVVQGYAARARRCGAHIETGCELLAVRLRGEAIEAAVTSKGAVETPALVCAASAWPRRVGVAGGWAGLYEVTPTTTP